MMLLGRIISHIGMQINLMSHGAFFSSYFIIQMDLPPRSCRALLSTTAGMGQHFSTPKKRRNKKKTQAHVILPGHSTKRQRLLQHLDDIFNDKSCEPEPPSSPPTVFSPDDGIIDPSSPVDDTLFQHLADEPPHEDVIGSDSVRSITADRLYESWSMVIPTIIESYLRYLTDTIGKPLSMHDTLLHNCHGDCEPKCSSLLCLYFDRASLTFTSV